MKWNPLKEKFYNQILTQKQTRFFPLFYSRRKLEEKNQFKKRRKLSVLCDKILQPRQLIVEQKEEEQRTIKQFKNVKR